MTSSGTVWWVLLVEAVATLSIVIVTLSHAAWMWWDERRNGPRLGRARLALAAALDGRDAAPPPPELRALSPRLQERLLSEAAPHLSGRARLRLSEIATALDLPKRAAALTHRRAWWRRLDGARLLTVYNVDLVTHSRLLTDAHPAVRAEAATWAGDNPTLALTRRLVVQLTDAAPLARVTAKDALLRAGVHAVEAIAEGLADQGRGVDDLLEVAARRPDSRYVDPAILLSAAPLPSTRAAAAALLGAVGGAAPAETLTVLLDDPWPDVRAASVTALGRLGHWPAAADVAPLLRDPAWDVRRAAGETLVAFGAPGLLLLRRMLNDDDAFASDMARQALEVAKLRAAVHG